MDIKVEDNKLTISVTVDALCHAIKYSNYWERWATDIGKEPTITDPLTFVREIARQLRKEAEDGSTIAHRMFDTAAKFAIEDGCEGVDE